MRADDGSWFMRGMLPYRSEDGRVDGLVITFAGISEIKAAEREIEAARAYLDSIIATIRQPLVVLDEDLRVVSASSSFHRIFSVKPEDLIGRHLRAAGRSSRCARPAGIPGLNPSPRHDHQRSGNRDGIAGLGTAVIFDERSRTARGAFSKAQDPGGDR